MLSRPVAAVAFFAIIPISAACTPQIHIVQPTSGLTQEPVPQVVAQFMSDFKPAEGWFVELNGTSITSFAPPPGPGATSSAPITLPPTTDNKYTIEADASCGFFCVYPSETVTFFPPFLVYNGTSHDVEGDLKQFVPTAEFIAVQFPRSVPIVVTIKETTQPFNIVKLGLTPQSLRPAGTPLQVVIPPNNTKADFFIEGDTAPTSYNLQFAAAGVAPGGGFGRISP